MSNKQRVECVLFFGGEDAMIGMVNNIDFQILCEIQSTLTDTLMDCGFAEPLPGNAICAHFVLTNFKYQEGQQTFPETGQWDFPPHWEMDIELTGYDVVIGDEIRRVDL